MNIYHIKKFLSIIEDLDIENYPKTSLNFTIKLSNK